MAIGFNIDNSLMISIGDSRDKLIDRFKEHRINYSIPFDKVNKNGIKETIIHIKDIDTEISIENDIVTYIKSGNTKHSNIMNLGNSDEVSLEEIEVVQKIIRDKFTNSSYIFKLEKVNIETMNITLIISSDIEKCRAQVVRDSNGDIYVNTIRAL